MPAAVTAYQPGQKVALTQQIAQRARTWTIRITGTVVRAEQRPTGSWFAHGKGDRLWLDRLVLRKDDGEVVVCVLDEFTRVETADAATKAEA